MIVSSCTSCESKFRVKPAFAGRKVKCPQCGVGVQVPPLDEPNPKTPAQVEPEPQPQEPAIPDFSVPAAPAPTSTAPATAPVSSFPIDASTASGASTKRKRKPKKRRGSKTPLWIAGAAAIAIVGGLGYFFSRPAPTKVVKLALKKMADQSISELESWNTKVVVKNAEEFPKLTFKFLAAPETAQINPNNGVISWTPTEADGNTTVNFEVQAQASGRQTAKQSFKVEVSEHNQPPRFEPIESAKTTTGQQVAFAIKAIDPDDPPVSLHYLLDGSAPLGALIDPSTGHFTWTADKEHEGQLVTFKVTATEIAPAGLTVDTEFTVAVEQVASEIDQLLAKLRSTGAQAFPKQTTGPPASFKGKSICIDINQQAINVYEYDSPAGAAEELANVNAAGSTLFGTEWTNETPMNVFRSGTLIATYEGQDEQTQRLLELAIGEPYAVIAKKTATTVVEVTPKRSEALDALIKLYETPDARAKKNRLLFSPREYASIRTTFSNEFEQNHADQIKAAFGDDYGDTMAWLNERPDLKEELFTAFKPEHDDVQAGLTLFKTLKDQFPEKIERYASLAIASAVTWDKVDGGIYDYEQHARRTHSLVPSELADAVANFKYLVDAENFMQGRILYVPWEFLTLIINHKTPTAERTWAMQNYAPRRVMFGKCYAEVPYDTTMLETKSEVCKLDGAEYNLLNIRQLGGVCAMQADYAARVGKSIGVPAAYVSGEGRYGGRHAWVMWVELKAVTAKSISFTLESHGRYRGDNYYVGDLRDPQTGEAITDRILELQMHQVGVDPLAKRQSERVMSVYNDIVKDLSLDFDARLDFLSQVLTLNPWSEAAWKALAKVHEGEELSKLQLKQMNTALGKLFFNFAVFPDFTLTIFDDLVSFEPDPKQRVKLYYRLLDVYATAKRPDLSFTALLTLADKLVEDKRENEAIQALAVAVKKYNDEGSYIPKMLDKLESLAGKIDGADAKVVQFYTEFLPLIPQVRGDRPSDYCIEMFERGIRKFQAAEQPQLMQLFSNQLQLIRSGRGRKS